MSAGDRPASARAVAEGACGLGDYLYHTNPDIFRGGDGDGDGTGEDGDGLGDEYRTIFPVAWYGSLGWKYYEARQRSTQMPPPPSSATGIRTDALERFPPHEPGTSRTPDGVAVRPLRPSMRPMGVLAPLFAWRPVRRVARWMVSHLALVLLASWVLITGWCVSLEFTPLRAIRSSTTGLHLDAALYVIGRFPVLKKWFRKAEFPLQLYRRLGMLPALTAQLTLLPLYAAWVLASHLNATRALLTFALVVLGLALGTGALLDWQPEGAPRSVHGWLRLKGAEAAFTVTFMGLGAFLLPALVTWVMRGAYPRASAWAVLDVLPFREGLLVMGAAAGLATASVFLAQFMDVMARDSEAAGAVRLLARAVKGSAVQEDESRRRTHLRSTQFHGLTLLSCLVAVIMVRVLVMYVCPEPFAEARVRAMLRRTAAWRPPHRAT